MGLDASANLFVGAPISEIPGHDAEDFDYWEFAEKLGLQVFDGDFERSTHIGSMVATLDALRGGLEEITPEDIEDTKQYFLRALAAKGITTIKPRLYLNTYISV
jgi:hypothetical protein